MGKVVAKSHGAKPIDVGTTGTEWGGKNAVHRRPSHKSVAKLMFHIPSSLWPVQTQRHPSLSPLGKLSDPDITGVDR